VLSTLRAVETVRAQIEPDWSGYFSSRLSGPGALDLVVEVAHDLRSPLTSILFLAETMIRGQSGAVTPVQRRQLGLVYGAALGLSSVASDVIELARGGDRLVERDPSAFSIAEIFESVCSIIQPIAEEKGLDVRTVLPAGEHRIGHRVALSRVLLNLTTNALRFTDEGFVEIAATASGPRNLEFSVRDTGRGITTDALTTLYQPFQRTRTRREYAFSGTGLGLTICAKLVRAMRSELRVETRPAWGTRFYFELDLPPASLD
jgi:signal transduction histidine kinase